MTATPAECKMTTKRNYSIIKSSDLWTRFLTTIPVSRKAYGYRSKKTCPNVRWFYNTVRPNRWNDLAAIVLLRQKPQSLSPSSREEQAAFVMEITK